jgi:hypothetical protein
MQISCSEKHDHVNAELFSGNIEAVQMADSMYRAIGGIERWCKLRSVYIKAKHFEPQMNLPYTSEIWRSMDDFDLIIEQQNDSFHVRGIMNDSLAVVNYLDKRDTSRVLSEELLEEWKFGNHHNVYVVLHRLACDPSSHIAKIENDQLAFYKDSVFVSRFGLDEEMRPHMFYAPNSDGSESGSRFTKWGIDDGLVHSNGGHPMDSSFLYITEVWQPGYSTVRESFDIE